ncbi:class II fructose-1,6-bisphosphate aldolase [Candidatus Woesearchaeota archaeon]|nr:class II fructose-1,6-bisphosphate aldolase [Candidatus Woesearchaeota archaeon]
MLAAGKSILKKAYDSGYAVGAFNINNLEVLKAVVSAADELNAPIFVQATAGAIKYAGIEELAAMVRASAKKSKIPIALHLDHGPDLNHVRLCIEHGFTSVMLDGSHLPFAKNVSITKSAARIAHARKVCVEGELGRLKGVEEHVKSSRHVFTEPAEAKKFVALTKVDSLAVAIGTSHGAYKFRGKPKLEIKRLKEINSLLQMPLVLHGASSVPKELVSKADRYGAAIKGANGVPDSELRKAVRNGIAKVNQDTDLRIALVAAVRKFLKENPKEYDPRNILAPAMLSIKEVVKKRIKVLGSEGRA